MGGPVAGRRETGTNASNVGGTDMRKKFVLKLH